MPSTTPDLRTDTGADCTAAGSSSGAGVAVTGRASGNSAVRWPGSADGAFLAARASAGHIAAKLGGSDGLTTGLDRNKKSSREAFNVSTAASGRSSAGVFGSGAATYRLPRAAGAYCAGPLGERGASSPCAGTPWSARGPSARGIVERSRSIAAAETSTDEGEGCWMGSGRASRGPASGRLRGAAGVFGAAGRGLATATGGGSEVAGKLGADGSNI